MRFSDNVLLALLALEPIRTFAAPTAETFTDHNSRDETSISIQPPEEQSVRAKAKRIVFAIPFLIPILLGGAGIGIGLGTKKILDSKKKEPVAVPFIPHGGTGSEEPVGDFSFDISIPSGGYIIGPYIPPKKTDMPTVPVQVSIPVTATVPTRTSASTSSSTSSSCTICLGCEYEKDADQAPELDIGESLQKQLDLLEPLLGLETATSTSTAAKARLKRQAVPTATAKPRSNRETGLSLERRIPEPLIKREPREFDVCGKKFEAPTYANWVRYNHYDWTAYTAKVDKKCARADWELVYSHGTEPEQKHPAKVATEHIYELQLLDHYARWRMGRDDVRNYLIARNIATDENTACTRVAEYFLTGKGAWAQREYFGSPEIQGGLPTPRQKLQAALSGDRLFASEFTFLGKELNGRKAVIMAGKRHSLSATTIDPWIHSLVKLVQIILVFDYLKKPEISRQYKAVSTRVQGVFAEIGIAMSANPANVLGGQIARAIPTLRWGNADEYRQWERDHLAAIAVNAVDFKNRVTRQARAALENGDSQQKAMWTSLQGKLALYPDTFFDLDDLLP